MYYLCSRKQAINSIKLNGYGKVYHYRNKSGLECNAVVHLRNGDYGLVKIKLSGKTRIDESAKTLNELEKKIDATKMKAPSFKMVLTAVVDYALRRPEDGIFVVPIGTLKPYTIKAKSHSIVILLVLFKELSYLCAQIHTIVVFYHEKL